MPERPNELATTADFEFSALQEAANYRAALIQEFAPFLKGRVIEAGAGIGQITTGLRALPDVTEIVAVEPDPRFCQMFRRLHPDLTLAEGTIDALDKNAGCDAIVCINVLEHIRDDGTELRKFRERLSGQRGYLCLFVPARQEIYAPIDEDFGHFRRYSRPELRTRLEEAGFTIQHLHYFNAIGYFAWWWTFCVLKKRRFEAGSVRLFDRLIFPAAHCVEKNVLRPPFGQSLLAIARADR